MPVVIGASGVEKIVEIELTAEEKAMLEKRADRRCAKSSTAASSKL